jgi:hypothetical protein
MSKMTSDHLRTLLDGLLDRGANRIELARDTFRRKYPEATDQMISAAVFHLFTEGIDACVEWLADLERFLADPDHKLCYGISSHLLYHVYNWHQLESLMPHGKTVMHELLDDILESAAENDMESVKRAVTEFKNILEGHDRPPTIEEQPAVDGLS